MPETTAREPALQLPTPRIHLLRMVVFLVLVGFLAFILHQPIRTAFLTNPGLNAFIAAVLFIGIVMAIAQVVRLFGATDWVNRNAESAARVPHIASEPPPLLGPMAALLGDRFSDSGSEVRISTPVMRSILDSIGLRLDENREILRYLAGLLVFLGLLGTFWGLLETVSSVGGVINSMRTGGEAGALFDELKSGLAAPLAGMGISFSSSLFGLAGSLVLGFLDLQVGQAQGRFYTGLEDWLASVASHEPAALTAQGALPPGSSALIEAIERLNASLDANVNASMLAGSRQEAAAAPQKDPAIGDLSEGIRDLVQNMRQEQQLIRDWVEAQAAQQRQLQRTLDRLEARGGRLGGLDDLPARERS